MGLLRKLRVLAGALVHKPFMPRQEKVVLDEGINTAGQEQPPRKPLRSDAESDVTDDERVADLIAKQQREQAD